jgi:hypothetical protein
VHYWTQRELFLPTIPAGKKNPTGVGLKFAANGGDRRPKSLGGGEFDSGRYAKKRLLRRLSSRPKENHDPQPIAGGVLLRARARRVSVITLRKGFRAISQLSDRLENQDKRQQKRDQGQQSSSDEEQEEIGHAVHVRFIRSTPQFVLAAVALANWSSFRGGWSQPAPLFSEAHPVRVREKVEGGVFPAGPGSAIRRSSRYKCRLRYRPIVPALPA